MNNESLRQVRRFNRAVTRRIGILTDDYLGRGRPWAESRLLFEVGESGADARELRERLSMDSGYLSRLLRSLEAQKLVQSRRGREDARVRRITLTRKGLGEWKEMEARSDGIAQTLLAPLNAANRSRLLAAMSEVEHLLAASAVKIEPEDPATPDARACIDAYVKELTRRFKGGFDPTRGPTANPDDLRMPRGLFLLARLEGEAVGCIALKVIGARVGEIKRMWVSPSARGLSIGRRLLEAAEQSATTLQLTRLRLDTNRSQAEAIALYDRSGYRKIDAYNDNPYADLWFEKRLRVSRA